MNKLIIVFLLLLITMLVFKIKNNKSKEKFQSPTSPFNNCSSINSQNTCNGNNNCFWDSSPQICRPRCELILDTNTCSNIGAPCIVNQQRQCIRECRSIISESSCEGNCFWDDAVTPARCHYSSNPQNTTPLLTSSSSSPSPPTSSPSTPSSPTLSTSTLPSTTNPTTTSQTQSGSPTVSGFVFGSGKSCKNISLTNPNVECTYIQPTELDDSYINLDRELNSHKQQYRILYHRN